MSIAYRHALTSRVSWFRIIKKFLQLNPSTIVKRCASNIHTVMYLFGMDLQSFGKNGGIVAPYEYQYTQHGILRTLNLTFSTTLLLVCVILISRRKQTNQNSYLARWWLQIRHIWFGGQILLKFPLARSQLGSFILLTVSSGMFWGVRGGFDLDEHRRFWGRCYSCWYWSLDMNTHFLWCRHPPWKQAVVC